MKRFYFFQKIKWSFVFFTYYFLSAQTGIIQQKQSVSGYDSNYTTDDQKKIDGCLQGSPGFAFPYTPSCMGMLETADGLARVGQYSKLAVTNGTKYTFSLSETSYFLTISDEDGTTVLASGTGTVTWTANYTGWIRYYTHLNSNCEWDENSFLTKYVQCSTPIIVEEPNFPCFQGDGLESNTPHMGYNIGLGENSYRTADDFVVAEGTLFTVKQVRLNVLSSILPTEFTLNFRENIAGAPGAIKHTVVMAPSTIRIVGSEGIYKLYEATMNLVTPLDFEAGIYWLQPEAVALSAGTTVFWELTSTGSNEATIQTSIDFGSSWMEDSSGKQAVFFIAGECNPVETMGTNNINKSELAFYPNPIKDILNIRSKKTIENVIIYNSTGQQILNLNKVINGQINLSSLARGVYMFKVTLEDGQVESFKIVKK